MIHDPDPERLDVPERITRLEPDGQPRTRSRLGDDRLAWIGAGAIHLCARPPRPGGGRLLGDGRHVAHEPRVARRREEERQLAFVLREARGPRRLLLGAVDFLPHLVQVVRVAPYALFEALLPLAQRAPPRGLRGRRPARGVVVRRGAGRCVANDEGRVQVVERVVAGGDVGDVLGRQKNERAGIVLDGCRCDHRQLGDLQGAARGCPGLVEPRVAQLAVRAPCGWRWQSARRVRVRLPGGAVRATQRGVGHVRRDSWGKRWDSRLDFVKRRGRGRLL